MYICTYVCTCVYTSMKVFLCMYIYIQVCLCTATKRHFFSVSHIYIYIVNIVVTCILYEVCVLRTYIVMNECEVNQKGK